MISRDFRKWIFKKIKLLTMSVTLSEINYLTLCYGFEEEKLFLTKSHFLALHYEFVKTKKTWNEAENHCKRIGGHLVTITSQKLDNQLLKMIQRQYVQPLKVACLHCFS